MSKQGGDSHHDGTMQNNFVSKVRDSGSSMDTRSSHDREMTCDRPKHVKPSTESVPIPDSTILQVGQYGKPSITLTSYDCNSASSSHTPVNSRPLLHLFRPISDDTMHSRTTHNLTPVSRDVRKEKAALVQLRVELEAHFQDLKSEFEAKRGKGWTPLRPWASEEWEWSEDGSADGEGTFDWS
jgi:hypothetical protein